MNNKLIKKLKSNSGASILISFVVFIVAATLSGTIILASTSSIRTVSSNVKEKRSQLLLLSGAQVLRDELASSKLNIIPVATYLNGEKDPDNGYDIPEFTGNLDEEIMGAYGSFEYFGDMPYPTSFTMSFDDQSSKNINVDMVIEKTIDEDEGVDKYLIKCELSLDKQKLYLYMVSEANEISDEEREELLDNYESESFTLDDGTVMLVTLDEDETWYSYTWPLKDLQIREVDDYD